MESCNGLTRKGRCWGSVTRIKPVLNVPEQDKVCPLCKQAGRSNANHFRSQCTFLADNDRHFMIKGRQIVCILDDEQVTQKQKETRDKIKRNKISMKVAIPGVSYMPVSVWHGFN